MPRNPMTLDPGLQAILDELSNEKRRELFAFEEKLDRIRAQQNRKVPVYLSRAITHMANQSLNGTPEGEFFEEVAKIHGRAYDPQRVFLPFAFFQRDLTAASASGGGYLVATVNARAQDILRPWSVVINGGITVEEGAQGNITIPKTVGTSTIYWQSTEATQATASDPTVQQVALTPKVAIGIINASRNFMVQANPEGWLRRELLRTAGTAIDMAALNGSGALGQPLGLVNTTGLSTQSGTSLGWAGVLAMKGKAATADAADSSIRFISTPAVRELLEARAKVANTARFIWEEDKIANCPAHASTLMPTATMVSGPMSGITLAIWGQGLEIQVNPYDPTMFKRGAVQIRVLLAVDVAVTANPAAYTLASSIT